MIETPNQRLVREAARVTFARYLLDKGLIANLNEFETSGEGAEFDKYVKEVEARRKPSGTEAEIRELVAESAMKTIDLIMI